MVKKMFPVQPLTSDKKLLMEIVLYYDKVIIHRDYKETFKLLAVLPITITLIVVFMLKIPVLYKVMFLLPIESFYTAIILLALKKNITDKQRSVISVLDMLIIVIWLINIMQLVLHKMQYDLVSLIITPYLLCSLVYYIGYIWQYKNFKEHMLEGNRTPKMRPGGVGLMVFLGSVIARGALRLTSAEFVTLGVFMLIFWMTSLFSRSLISYFQYDNIQVAKKELGLKGDS